ncbi:unnamed protein product [Brugia timori]|uniref:C-type lectin domain-containing protein n=1 Tax=Brugia timori TaxID=42155 RepID=A0A0R3QMU4_9BILA|nr:unnamed protein product [Brugia timori]
MLNFHIEKLNVTYWEQCVHPSSLQTMISMSTNFLLISSPLILQIKSYLLILDNILSEPMTIFPSHAVYQNGRCYVPYVTEEPLSIYNAQTKCLKKVMLQSGPVLGGQLAFSVGLIAEKKIAIVVQRQVHNNKSSCYWMDGFERLGGSSFCDCYYITSRRAFWNQRNCNSSQQWVCQFAPETQSTEVHNKFMKQHTIFNRLWNVERFEWKVQQVPLVAKDCNLSEP